MRTEYWSPPGLSFFNDLLFILIQKAPSSWQAVHLSSAFLRFSCSSTCVRFIICISLTDSYWIHELILIGKDSTGYRVRRGVSLQRSHDAKLVTARRSASSPWHFTFTSSRAQEGRRSRRKYIPIPTHPYLDTRLLHLSRPLQDETSYSSSTS